MWVSICGVAPKLAEDSTHMRFTGAAAGWRRLRPSFYSGKVASGAYRKLMDAASSLAGTRRGFAG